MHDVLGRAAAACPIAERELEDEPHLVCTAREPRSRTFIATCGWRQARDKLAEPLRVTHDGPKGSRTLPD